MAQELVHRGAPGGEPRQNVGFGLLRGSGGVVRPGGIAGRRGGVGPYDPTAATEQAEAEILARLTAWRAAVDELLRHPAASER